MVLLLADDLGWGDLSVSGHPTSRTPNIDRCSVEHSRAHCTGATCHVPRVQAGHLLGAAELPLLRLPGVLPLPRRAAHR